MLTLIIGVGIGIGIGVEVRIKPGRQSHVKSCPILSIPIPIPTPTPTKAENSNAIAQIFLVFYDLSVLEKDLSRQRRDKQGFESKSLKV